MTTSQVQIIPLDQIDVDWDWNARSLANVLSESSEEDPESAGLSGLISGLVHDGQDTPVDVRPTNTPGFYKRCARPYSLVAGFRRFAAVTRINADRPFVKQRESEKRTVIPGIPNGTIRANVRHLGELEARRLNLAENTNRDAFSTPDLLHGVGLLHKQHKMSANQIAASLGKSPVWITKLLAIAVKVDPKVLDHYRQGGELKVDGKKVTVTVRATVDDLSDIAKMPLEAQLPEYVRILTGRTRVRAAPHYKMWAEALKRKADRLGYQLGTLQRNGVLTMMSLPWDEWIHLVVKAGDREARRRDVQKLGRIAQRAYERAMGEKEYEEED
jgi:ParB-like chromosome segregation protein Spo0J